jgi:hypothetical protein
MPVYQYRQASLASAVSLDYVICTLIYLLISIVSLASAVSLDYVICTLIYCLMPAYQYHHDVIEPY